MDTLYSADDYASDCFFLDVTLSEDASFDDKLHVAASAHTCRLHLRALARVPGQDMDCDSSCFTNPMTCSIRPRGCEGGRYRWDEAPPPTILRAAGPCGTNPAVGQIRIADTGLILAARRAGSQLAASTAVRRTAAVVPSVSGS